MAQRMNGPLVIACGIGALLLAGGVASKVLKDRRVADHAQAERAWRSQTVDGMDSIADEPRRAEGLGEDDVPILMSSVPDLIGKVELAASSGLLYRVGDDKLVACQVTPGAAARVTCHDLDVPIRPSSARFVEGQPELVVYGVTEMGSSPETTKYGAFRAFSAEPLPGDATKLALAPDRPRLGPASDAWYRGRLGPSEIVLRRDAKQNLVLEREGAITIVLRSPDRGGPKTGSPLIFHHDEGLVAVFQTGHGLAAMVVRPSGEASALEPSL